MISKRPTLIPYLFVNDAEISIEFYRRCFGMELIKKSRDENNQIIHMEMTFKDALIMLAPEGACGETAQTPNHRNAACPVTLYLYCEDPDGIYATAIQGGAKCRIAPKDMFWESVSVKWKI